MFKIPFVPVFLILFHLSPVIGQESDTSYRQLHMTTLKVQNDLLQYWYQSDKEFTNGMQIGWYHSIFNNKAADWFLLGLRKSQYKDFGLNLFQEIYTPENLSSTTVNYNDRPYAALLYLRYDKISNRYFKGRKLTTSFYLGIRGKQAGGEEVQNWVHDKLGNELANGWENQMGTAVMVDYEMTYQHLLPFSNHRFESHAMVNGRVGTMNIYASAGLYFKMGLFSDSYINSLGILNRRNHYSWSREGVRKFGKSKLKLIPRKYRGDEEAMRDYLEKRMNRKIQFFLDINTRALFIFYEGTRWKNVIPVAGLPYQNGTTRKNTFLGVGSYGLHFQYHRYLFEYNRVLTGDVLSKSNIFGFGEIAVSVVF